MNTPTVFVVDDEPSIRTSLRLLLESKGLAVQTYASGEEFLAQLDPLRPGCIVLDLRMSEMSGLEVQKELARRNCRLPHLFLSAFGDIPTTVDVIKAGAEDFLTKPPNPDVLIERIQSLLRQSQQDYSLRLEQASVLERFHLLSPREQQILQRALEGMSNKEIAQQLSLSPRTVENNRLRMIKKLGTQNLLEFSHQAVSCGIDLNKL